MRQVRQARADLFDGMYDGTSGHGTPSLSVVRCPRCRHTIGNVTGSGWRQSRCHTCGSSLWLRQVDRSGRRVPQVRLLNPDYSDDDPIGRRFALLEIE
jgi:hypothetical protein